MVVVDFEEYKDPSEDDDGLEDGEGDGDDVEEDLDDGRVEDVAVLLLHFVSNDHTIIHNIPYIYFRIGCVCTKSIKTTNQQTTLKKLFTNVLNR